MLENGSGCKKSPEEALSYYMLASNAGNSQGNFKLGQLYYKGVSGSIEKDYHLAIRYFLLAAEGGNSNALCQLGFIYDSGHGVEVFFFF